MGCVTVNRSPRSSRTMTYAAGRGCVKATQSPSGTGRVPTATVAASRRRSNTVASPRGSVCGSAGGKNAATPRSGTGVTVPGVPTTVMCRGRSSPESNPATRDSDRAGQCHGDALSRAARPRRAMPASACAAMTTIAIATMVVYCQPWYQSRAGNTSCATVSPIASTANANAVARAFTSRPTAVRRAPETGPAFARRRCRARRDRRGRRSPSSASRPTRNSTRTVDRRRQDRKRYAVRSCKRAGGCGRLALIDAEHDQPARTFAAIERFERRHLFFARRTPGRPKIHQHDRAAMRGQRIDAAADARDGEAHRRRAGQHCRPAAAVDAVLGSPAGIATRNKQSQQQRSGDTTIFACTRRTSDSKVASLIRPNAQSDAGDDLGRPLLSQRNCGSTLLPEAPRCGTAASSRIWSSRSPAKTRPA